MIIIIIVIDRDWCLSILSNCISQPVEKGVQIILNREEVLIEIIHSLILILILILIKIIVQYALIFHFLLQFL